jgi:putative ATPase
MQLSPALPPLAERLRPASLDGMIGQEHLVAPGGILRQAIATQNIPSLILWGPPGVGKTTLANIIANEVKRPLIALSAVHAGVKEVREAIDQAKLALQPILFIDEIHRFNKAQQDALLGAVEKGTVTLIGATTENPSFEVNAALLSRCQVYVLRPLTPEHLLQLVRHALATDEALKTRAVTLREHNALFQLAGGDARKALNLLELLVQASADPVEITDERVMHTAQKHLARYDKSGEQHYDMISAFIKSIRGSDPNAAMYYLARMIAGGEDVKFIARRMVILASEDIGHANPTALVLATSAFQAVTYIGYPEARIILAQCAGYLACSPKSNSSYVAIEQAIEKVHQTGDLPVPLALRNAPTQLMKDLHYGHGYRYAHEHPGHFANMEFLPDALRETVFYKPAANPREEEMRNTLKKWWGEKYGY